VKEVKPHFATMETELSAFWRSFTIDKQQQKRKVRRHRVSNGEYSTVKKMYKQVYEKKTVSQTYFVIAKKRTYISNLIDKNYLF
jgi:hypothetical protein